MEISVKEYTTEEQIQRLRAEIASTDANDAMRLIGLNQQLAALIEKDREEKEKSQHGKNENRVQICQTPFRITSFVSNIQVHDKGIFLLSSDHNFVILGWDGKEIAKGNIKESLGLDKGEALPGVEGMQAFGTSDK